MAVLSNNDLTFANGGGYGLYYSPSIANDTKTICTWLLDNMPANSAPCMGIITIPGGGTHMFWGYVYSGREYGVVHLTTINQGAYPMICRRYGNSDAWYNYNIINQVT